jgi:hypothetical protein
VHATFHNRSIAAHSKQTRCGIFAVCQTVFAHNATNTCARKTTRSAIPGGRNGARNTTAGSSTAKGSGEHWLRPVFAGHRVGTSTLPLRSVALPLPDSILLAGKLGVLPAVAVGVLFCAVSFRACHCLPAVTVRTPTGQKVGNRSIALPLNNLRASICRSNLPLQRISISSFISIT